MRRTQKLRRIAPYTPRRAEQMCLLCVSEAPAHWGERSGHQEVPSGMKPQSKVSEAVLEEEGLSQKGSQGWGKGEGRGEGTGLGEALGEHGRRSCRGERDEDAEGVTPSPGRCDSVGWVPPRKEKGQWLHSWSGHTPGWQVQLMFLSLSFSLPSPLSKNYKKQVTSQTLMEEHAV